MTHIRFVVAVFILSICTAATADDVIRRIRLSEDSAIPDAIRVAHAHLVHTDQLLPIDPSAGIEEQAKSVLDQLDRVLKTFGANASDVVRINGYVGESVAGDLLRSRIASWASGNGPTVTQVTTRLPLPGAVVGIDAIFVARDGSEAVHPVIRRHTTPGSPARPVKTSVLPPGDVVYVSGQAEPGQLPDATLATLQGLLRTLREMHVEKDHIVHLKCFLQPMEDVAMVNTQIAKFFEGAQCPPVSHVEWISKSRPIEIELIAFAPPSEGERSVTFWTPPWMESSDVFSRVARIHSGERIYVSGLRAETPGDGADQVHSLFDQLRRIMTASGSDLQHLAKATYYVTDADGSNALNQLRPSYYDPMRPPAASKAVVAGVAATDRSVMVEMIAAPVTPHDR